MSTPIGVLLLLAFLIWVLVALAVAVVLGMSISGADREEGKSCCPHPPGEAPETVRGQFRAVVVQLPPQRPDPLDVKA